MIFVTVGTHEQPFDRLLQCVDELKASGVLTEEVVMQTGFSTYTPKYCQWKKMMPHREIVRLIQQARIVITHGGPSSFLLPVQEGKVPVVVPRMRRYGEHVNDHQVLFCREISIRYHSIILVEDVRDLKSVLTRYDAIAASCRAGVNSNNSRFNRQIQDIVDELFHGQTHSERKAEELWESPH